MKWVPVVASSRFEAKAVLPVPAACKRGSRKVGRFEWHDVTNPTMTNDGLARCLKSGAIRSASGDLVSCWRCWLNNESIINKGYRNTLAMTKDAAKSNSQAIRLDLSNSLNRSALANLMAQQHETFSPLSRVNYSSTTLYQKQPPASTADFSSFTSVFFPTALIFLNAQRRVIAVCGGLKSKVLYLKDLASKDIGWIANNSWCWRRVMDDLAYYQTHPGQSSMTAQMLLIFAWIDKIFASWRSCVRAGIKKSVRPSRTTW